MSEWVEYIMVALAVLSVVGYMWAVAVFIDWFLILR